MLVASETFFFEQSQAHHQAQEERAYPTGTIKDKIRKNVDRLVTDPFSTPFRRLFRRFILFSIKRSAPRR
jgi:hypothetical protein